MTKRVIVWDKRTGNGVAPDGTVYGINSEHIRGEPRQYWAELANGRELQHPTDPGATSRDKAIQAAEHHYRSTHPEPHDSAPDDA